jgi:homoserine acetyltransferase
MDLYDVSNGFKNTNEALSNIKCPVMIMGSQTDILFPVTQQRQLANALKDSGNSSVTYFEMDSLYGHDTFLLNINDVGTAVKVCIIFLIMNLFKC